MSNLHGLHTTSVLCVIKLNQDSIRECHVLSCMFWREMFFNTWLFPFPGSSFMYQNGYRYTGTTVVNVPTELDMQLSKLPETSILVVTPDDIHYDVIIFHQVNTILISPQNI